VYRRCVQCRGLGQEDGQTDRQTDRQTAKQTHMHRDRQPDGET